MERILCAMPTAMMGGLVGFLADRAGFHGWSWWGFVIAVPILVALNDSAERRWGQ